jgi:hypothetical protein
MVTYSQSLWKNPKSIQLKQVAGKCNSHSSSESMNKLSIPAGQPFFISQWLKQLECQLNLSVPKMDGIASLYFNPNDHDRNILAKHCEISLFRGSKSEVSSLIVWNPNRQERLQ